MAKVSSVNALPATGSAAMYIVKTQLVAAGWVVIGSGDGLALYSAAGDIITTGSAGAGGLGQVNAWFAIRDASTKVAFTFQMVTTVNWRVKYTETGAFAGGTPGISRTGTAADEQVLYGAGTDAAPTGTQMLHTDNTYRFHVVCNSTAQTGSGTFPFWFGCTISATGVEASFFGLEGMASATYNTLDTAPRVIITWYVATGPVTAGWSASTADAVSLYTRGWMAHGIGTAAFKRICIASYYFGATGTASVHTGLAVATNTSLGNSPYAGTPDMPLPCIFGRTVVHGTLPGAKGAASSYKINTCLGRAYPTTVQSATDAYVYYGGLLVYWPESTAPSL